MKTKLLIIVGLVLIGVPALADQPAQLFDDLNSNGISDREEQAANSDPSAESEESVDAEQPVDEITTDAEESSSGESQSQ